jgi:hypothetical protein
LLLFKHTVIMSNKNRPIKLTRQVVENEFTSIIYSNSVFK